MNKLHRNVQRRSNSLPHAAPLQSSCMAMACLSLALWLLQTKEKIVVKVDDELVRIGVDRTEQEEKARLHTAAHHEHECVAKHLGRREGETNMRFPLDLACSLLPLPDWVSALEMPCRHSLTAACRRQAAAHTCG